MKQQKNNKQRSKQPAGTCEATLRDLVRLLDELNVLNADLATVIREKRKAMSKGNLEAIAEVMERENHLVATIRERNGLRQKMMEIMGQHLSISAPIARSMRARDLAKRVAKPWGQKIMRACTRIKRSVYEVSLENRITDATARGVLAHMEQVFSWIHASLDRPVGYSAEGVMVSDRDQRLIETVG